ncbi:MULTISPECIES: hypothetical protein [unclassified Chitinophaga]|uniref:hypothetical protein n=1 Tax=unclassified Chitinophaga TaxID=2619133 RepID=UPI00117DD5AC|nr:MULTISPECIES: hypothetical protein [unclassified Chitinophaga]WPV69604.1 hypothetical protein QQL36_12945 [Chitinophaga sp. LS1]
MWQNGLLCRIPPYSGRHFIPISIAATGDSLYLPVKSAIKKFSLSLGNNDTKLRLSQLGDKAGVMGRVC